MGHVMDRRPSGAAPFGAVPGAATLDEDALSDWGRRIGERVRGPVWITLSGELGAGKSVLARAIGAGAGVTEPMPSPSYNLAFRYATASGREVVHLDLYRLAAPEEVWELGWSALGAEDEIVLVEWPERAEDLLPADRWLVRLSAPPEHPGLRKVEVRRLGRPMELPPVPVDARP